MIKIIKQGTRKICSCEKCGCVFSFDAEDVETHNGYIGGEKRFVKCPQCGEEISLSQTRKVEE